MTTTKRQAKTKTAAAAVKRLEYLRGELRAERVSWGELHELQTLVRSIEAGDTELLWAAGVPEEVAMAGAKALRRWCASRT